MLYSPNSTAKGDYSKKCMVSQPHGCSSLSVSLFDALVSYAYVLPCAVANC